MRLIDLDYALVDVDRHGSYPNDYPDRWLEELPLVDAVPVIRCRNCTYYHSFDGESGVCKGGLGDCNMVSADGFCDWAVKRNEEDKKI